MNGLSVLKQNKDQTQNHYKQWEQQWTNKKRTRPDLPSCNEAINRDKVYNQSCRLSHVIHVISNFLKSLIIFLNWSLKLGFPTIILNLLTKYWLCVCGRRTSDGGYGNHSVSLPIILIKNKVDQMIPSSVRIILTYCFSYISSLLDSILWFCIWFPISMKVRLYFGATMVTFCIIHIGMEKYS